MWYFWLSDLISVSKCQYSGYTEALHVKAWSILGGKRKIRWCQVLRWEQV